VSKIGKRTLLKPIRLGSGGDSELDVCCLYGIQLIRLLMLFVNDPVCILTFIAPSHLTRQRNENDSLLLYKNMVGQDARSFIEISESVWLQDYRRGSIFVYRGVNNSSGK